MIIVCQLRVLTSQVRVFKEEDSRRRHCSPSSSPSPHGLWSLKSPHANTVDLTVHVDDLSRPTEPAGYKPNLITRRSTRPSSSVCELTMAFASSVEPRPSRRNARSLDLDSETTKAAAWVWHLHQHCNPPGVTTEARFVTSRRRRRSSGGGTENRISRFRQEATVEDGAQRPDARIWDCGSSLYDTFELVRFGDHLDRSLLQALPTVDSSFRERSRSSKMDHHMQLRKDSASVSCGLREGNEQEEAGGGAARKDEGASASTSSALGENSALPKMRSPGVEKMIKTLKKVLSGKRTGLTGCRKTIDVIERTTRSVSGVRDLMVADCSNGDVDGQVVQIPGGKSSKPRNRKPVVAGSCVSSFDHMSFPSKLGCQKNPLSESLDWRDGLPAVAKNHDRENTYHKHLHHHHHHHHHHHYLHHPLPSESARFSQDTMPKLRVCRS